MTKPRSRKHSIADVRLAIEKVGTSPKAIADELNCSRGTVYGYLKIPELKAFYESKKGGQVESKKQFSKVAFEAAIKDSHGIKAAVCVAVGCSRQTLDNYLSDYPDLKGQLELARAGLVAKATNALIVDIDNPGTDRHQRAYMHVLNTIGKDEGFIVRNEVTGKDGAALLDIPADLVKQIEASGLNLVEVLRNFVALPPPEAV